MSELFELEFTKFSTLANSSLFRIGTLCKIRSTSPKLFEENTLQMKLFVKLHVFITFHTNFSHEFFTRFFAVYLFCYVSVWKSGSLVFVKQAIFDANFEKFPKKNWSFVFSRHYAVCYCFENFCLEQHLKQTISQPIPLNLGKGKRQLLPSIAKDLVMAFKGLGQKRPESKV